MHVTLTLLGDIILNPTNLFSRNGCRTKDNRCTHLHYDIKQKAFERQYFSEAGIIVANSAV